MCKLLKQIRADWVNARKNRESNKKTTLGTLVGAIENETKGTGKELTDDIVVKNIKKLLKGLKTTLELIENSNIDGISTKIIETENEINVLESYVPKMMDEDELRLVIENIVSKGNSNIGYIMGQLKKDYPNQYEGKTASKIAKSFV